MSSSNYRLKGEFGEAFFCGTRADVNMVKKAMIKYGIAERKLHIFEPKYSDYVMPKHLKDMTDHHIVEHVAEGMNYADHRYEMAGYEVDEMTDYDRMQAYEDAACDNDELLDSIIESFNSYQAEKILLEG